MNDSRLTRRSLVRGTAVGLAGAAAIAGSHGALAGGVSSRFFALEGMVILS